MSTETNNDINDVNNYHNVNLDYFIDTSTLITTTKTIERANRHYNKQKEDLPDERFDKLAKQKKKMEKVEERKVY